MNSGRKFDSDIPEDLKQYTIMIELDIAARAYSQIIRCHHDIVQRYGRGNNADLHYDMIYNMIQSQCLRLLEEIKKVPDPKVWQAQMHEHLDSIYNRDNREPYQHAHVPTGETIQ